MSVNEMNALNLSTKVKNWIAIRYKGWTSKERDEEELVALRDGSQYKISGWEGRPRFSECSSITISEMDFIEVEKNGKIEHEDIDFFT